MARQAGPYRAIGTVDDLCFYKMDGVYYVRMKSSLTGKRFWNDKAFEGSRKSSSRFAEGNQVASKVYQTIEKQKRVYPLFCFLKRRAILLLKEGKSSGEVEKVLIDYLIHFGAIEKEKRTKENNYPITRMDQQVEGKTAQRFQKTCEAPAAMKPLKVTVIGRPPRVFSP